MSKRLLVTLGVAVCVAVVGWVGGTLFSSKAAVNMPSLLPPDFLLLPTLPTYAQWEYDVYSTLGGTLSVGELNARGGNGWELAAVYHTQGFTSTSLFYTYIFKRTPK